MRGQARQSTPRPRRTKRTSRGGEEGNSPQLLPHHRRYRVRHPSHLLRMESPRHHHVRRKDKGRRLHADSPRTPLQQQKSNTATSSKTAAGGTTSSAPAKQNDRPRDDRGKWYMPRGTDAQMQIDAHHSKLMSEGRCFRCQKKGHLSKDCPEKTVGHQVRAVEAAPTEPPKDSQMKDSAGKD